MLKNQYRIEKVICWHSQSDTRVSFPLIVCPLKHQFSALHYCANTLFELISRSMEEMILPVAANCVLILPLKTAKYRKKLCRNENVIKSMSKKVCAHLCSHPGCTLNKVNLWISLTFMSIHASLIDNFHYLTL